MWPKRSEYHSTRNEGETRIRDYRVPVRLVKNEIIPHQKCDIWRETHPAEIGYERPIIPHVYSPSSVGVTQFLFLTMKAG